MADKGVSAVRRDDEAAPARGDRSRARHARRPGPRNMVNGSALNVTTSRKPRNRRAENNGKRGAVSARRASAAVLYAGLRRCHQWLSAVSHSSHSTSSTAGRPSSDTSTRESSMWTTCICSVFTRKFWSFPQLGHVKRHSGLLINGQSLCLLKPDCRRWDLHAQCRSVPFRAEELEFIYLCQIRALFQAYINCASISESGNTCRIACR